MTTRLSLYVRPFESYDPSKREHRKALSEYLATGSWANCSVQFVNEGYSGEHLPVMYARTLEYYAQREFGQAI